MGQLTTKGPSLKELLLEEKAACESSKTVNFSGKGLANTSRQSKVKLKVNNHSKYQSKCIRSESKLTKSYSDRRLSSARKRFQVKFLATSSCLSMATLSTAALRLLYLVGMLPKVLLDGT